MNVFRQIHELKVNFRIIKRTHFFEIFIKFLIIFVKKANVYGASTHEVSNSIECDCFLQRINRVLLNIQ